MLFCVTVSICFFIYVTNVASRKREREIERKYEKNKIEMDCVRKTEDGTKVLQFKIRYFENHVK